MGKTKEYPIHSISEFTRLIETECGQGTMVLFRGQQQDWPLLPNLARFDPNLATRSLTDPDLPLLLAAEERLFEDFKRQSLPHLELKPDSDWDWLALAEHFGLPTRLLDWSTNGLASLWFAINEPVPPDEAKVSPYGVIWILMAERSLYLRPQEYETFSPFHVDRPYIVRPSHVAGRLVAQAGMFTVHPSSRTEPHFAPLDETESFAGNLMKVRIPHSIFQELKCYLNRLGVNHYSIFPELSGLCRQLAWSWSRASTAPEEPEADSNSRETHPS